jgi:ubiquinone biosynthesis protein
MEKLTPIFTYKHIKRFREISQVLAKHGFGEFIDQIRIWEYTNIKRRLLKRRNKRPPKASAPQRLRLAFEELGPTFVKIGQIISSRPDILPQRFIIELEKLQNQVSTVRISDIKKVITEELEKPINEIFESFDNKPVAAASLSQVHKAVLKSNQEVAVKVQRPGIIDIINADLEIMEIIVNLAQNQLKSWEYLILLSL